jgi:glycosyltransferase involved in cell wall biosynthesis
MEAKKNDTIRVLQLCEHFGNRTASFHGVARSFELWLPELNRAPVEVLLCSRAKPEAAALERYRKAGVEPLSLGYGKLDPRNLERLIGILRREKIDVMHLHGYGACTWGRIAGHLLGIPVIVHERCNYVTVPWFQRPVEWVLGPFTKYAFAVSESTRVFTVRKRYIRDDRVKLLYSGIPLKGLPLLDAEGRRAARRASGIEDDVFLLGVVSRLEPHKGHEDVLRVLAEVGGKLPKWRAWILGDGYYQADLERKAREMGLADRVEFLGYRADVWPLIQCLDLQIFPSHREGTPNTLYEALAVGNAILASTADGQGEILADGREALTFAPGDVAAMGEKLLRMAAEPELRERLRRAAKARAADFDMAKTVQTIRETYLSIMGRT